MSDPQTPPPPDPEEEPVRYSFPGLPGFITIPLEYFFALIGGATSVVVDAVGERAQRAATHARPWVEFIDLSMLGLAEGGLSAYVERIKMNAPYFMLNYVIIGLALTFISEITKPLTLIGILVLVWLYFQFFGTERRHSDYEIFGFSLDSKEKLGIMVLVGFFVFWLTSGGLQIFISILTAVVFISLVHGALRKPAPAAIPIV